MKIKIKTTKEYNEQNYLIAIISVLLIPAIFVGICKLAAPGISPEMVSDAFLNSLGPDNVWFSLGLISAWAIFLIAFLYSYIKAKKQPNEKEFSEICFDEQGVRLTKEIQKEKYFLSHSYEDIKNLELGIKTKWQKTSRGAESLAIERIDLIFEMLSENKIIKINLFGKLDYIYKILDYHKRFKNFSYNITGPTDVLVEKIEFYKKFGKKELIPNGREFIVYFFALTTFVMFVLQSVQYKSYILDNEWAYGIFPAFLFFISLILFAIIIIDKRTKQGK